MNQNTRNNLTVITDVEENGENSKNKTPCKRISFINAETVPKPVDKPAFNIDLHKLGSKIKLPQIEKTDLNSMINKIISLSESLKRLKEVAYGFNASEQYKNDIEFLTNNIGSALTKMDDDNE